MARVENHERLAGIISGPSRGHLRSDGCTKGGLNGKLHLLGDVAGRPVRNAVCAGNEADVSYAKRRLEPVTRTRATVIADPHPDAVHLRKWLGEGKVSFCIPRRKKPQKTGQIIQNVLQIGNPVERMFNCTSQCCHSSSVCKYSSPQPLCGIVSLLPGGGRAKRGDSKDEFLVQLARSIGAIVGARHLRSSDRHPSIVSRRRSSDLATKRVQPAALRRE